MGRMLDALWRTDGTRDKPLATPKARSFTDTVSDAEPLLVETEEIPFIEVGPRKSIEGSPSVMACTPAPAPLAMQALVSPRLPQPPQDIPSTRSVQFRALPSRSVGHSILAPELVVHHAPDQAAARQYRNVLDAVLNACSAQVRPTVLLFSSAQPRIGCTTTLLNLALAAAQQKHHPVLAVDANLTEPALAQRLGLPATPGLRETMAGTATLDQAIQSTSCPNLFALTAGIREALGVRFVAETLRSLLRPIRQRYPLVFVDGPRWDGRADVSALGVACDAAFLVVGEHEVESERTEELMRSIAGTGARLAGCVLVACP